MNYINIENTKLCKNTGSISYYWSFHFFIDIDKYLSESKSLSARRWQYVFVQLDENWFVLQTNVLNFEVLIAML